MADIKEELPKEEPKVDAPAAESQEETPVEAPQKPVQEEPSQTEKEEDGGDKKE